MKITILAPVFYLSWMFIVGSRATGSSSFDSDDASFHSVDLSVNEQDNVIKTDHHELTVPAVEITIPVQQTSLRVRKENNSSPDRKSVGLKSKVMSFIKTTLETAYFPLMNPENSFPLLEQKNSFHSSFNEHLKETYWYTVGGYRIPVDESNTVYRTRSTQIRIQMLESCTEPYLSLSERGMTKQRTWAGYSITAVPAIKGKPKLAGDVKYLEIEFKLSNPNRIVTHGDPSNVGPDAQIMLVLPPCHFYIERIVRYETFYNYPKEVAIGTKTPVAYHRVWKIVY